MPASNDKTDACALLPADKRLCFFQYSIKAAALARENKKNAANALSARRELTSQLNRFSETVYPLWLCRNQNGQTIRQQPVNRVVDTHADHTDDTNDNP